MDETPQNETTTIRCDGLTFEMFKKLTQFVDGVGSLCSYQTPNEAVTYIDEGNMTPFVNMLIDYQKNEKWRVKNQSGVKFSQSDTTISIDGVEFSDFSLCLAIPSANSVFIVPGPETVASGSVSPATVMRLTNMYSCRPALLSIHERDEGIQISFNFMKNVEGVQGA